MNIKLWEEKNSTEVLNLSETSGKNAAKDTISKTERKLIVKPWYVTIPKNTSGIYQILNEADGKIYYGSSYDIRKRAQEHFRLLLRGKHENSKLQRACNKHGLDKFCFSIIKECDVLDLNKEEQVFLDKCKLNKNNYYNLVHDAERPFLNISFSMARRRKRSNKQKVKLFHLESGKIFFGTAFSFCLKYELTATEACCLVNERLLTSHGWILYKRKNEIVDRRVKMVNLKTNELFYGDKSGFVSKFPHLSKIKFWEVANRSRLSSFNWALEERRHEFIEGRTKKKQKDKTIHNFTNLISGEEFSGTQYQLSLKVRDKPLSMSALVLNKILCLYRWVKTENIEKFLLNKNAKQSLAKIKKKNPAAFILSHPLAIKAMSD